MIVQHTGYILTCKCAKKLHVYIYATHCTMACTMYMLKMIEECALKDATRYKLKQYISELLSVLENIYKINPDHEHVCSVTFCTSCSDIIFVIY